MIFLDLDETLVHFFKDMYEGETGKRLDIYDINSYPLELGKYEVLSDVTNKPLSSLASYFINPSWTLEAKGLLKLSREICIVTNHSDIPQIAMYKVAWLRKYLKHVPYIITKYKHFLAKEDNILIDDCDGYVDKFNESGGKGILLPRPWNSAYQHAKNPLEYVNERLYSHSTRST